MSFQVITKQLPPGGLFFQRTFSAIEKRKWELDSFFVINSLSLILYSEQDSRGYAPLIVV